MTYDVLARAARSRRARRWRTALLAGAAVMLLVGGYLMAGRSGGKAATPPAAVPSMSGAASASAQMASGQPDPGTTAPLPDDLAWLQVVGVAVPVSATVGPMRRTADGLASGFSHDRAGAVLAATSLLLHTTAQVGPKVFGPTLRDQVSGPYAAALSDQVNADYQQLCARAGVAPGGPVGTLTARFVGYQVQLYDDSTVLLRLLTEDQQNGGAPLYAATVVQVAWASGDWSLVAPAGGGWQQSMTQVAATDIGAFNPFTAGR